MISILKERIILICYSPPYPTLHYTSFERAKYCSYWLNLSILNLSFFIAVYTNDNFCSQFKFVYKRMNQTNKTTTPLPIFNPLDPPLNLFCSPGPPIVNCSLSNQLITLFIIQQLTAEKALKDKFSPLLLNIPLKRGLIKNPLITPPNLLTLILDMRKVKSTKEIFQLFGF